jgi:hypothetical protein
MPNPIQRPKLPLELEVPTIGPHTHLLASKVWAGMGGLWLLAKTTPPLMCKLKTFLGSLNSSSKSLISQVIDFVDNELGFIVFPRLKHLNFVGFVTNTWPCPPSLLNSVARCHHSTQIPTFSWFQDFPVLLKLPRDLWSLPNHNINSSHQVQLLLGPEGDCAEKIKLG